LNLEVVAYHISDRNDHQLVLTTVCKTLEKRKDVTGTILHSDRGYQYTSYEYHQLPAKFGIRPSMPRKGKLAWTIPASIRFLRETHRAIRYGFVNTPYASLTMHM
jgi:transposase InsO family protein